MEKRREILSKAMADFLEIPKDLVMDIPKVTLIGRNELYLENHRGIIEYSLTRVRINLSRGYIEIEGEDMEIKALLPEELSLYGQIKSIKYLD
jgi:sporulation protein YqfC